MVTHVLVLEQLSATPHQEADQLACRCEVRPEIITPSTRVSVLLNAMVLAMATLVLTCKVVV